MQGKVILVEMFGEVLGSYPTLELLQCTSGVAALSRFSLDILERLPEERGGGTSHHLSYLSGNVIYKKGSISSPVIKTANAMVLLLSCSVPDLKLNRGSL